MNTKEITVFAANFSFAMIYTKEITVFTIKLSFMMILVNGLSYIRAENIIVLYNIKTKPNH